MSEVPPLGGGELARALDAARAGDEDGFRALFHAVHPGLLRYLQFLVGDDAEDVASETWLHIVRDLRSFHGTGDAFRGWAATIGRHRAMDHLRRMRRRPAWPTPAESLPDRADGADTAGYAAELMSTREALALIAGLPPDQAEVVLLRVVAGFDTVTTARILGKRPGAVRAAALRGLRGLARILEVRRDTALTRASNASAGRDATEVGT